MRFVTRTNLLPHQEPAVAKLLPSRVGALFMDMGTGKSRVAIELARLRQGKWDRLLWYAPVSLKETARQELLKHTNLRDEDIHVFDDRTRADRLPKARCHIVGIESMSASARVVRAVDALVSERSFVLVDESEYIKNNLSRRGQRIIHMSERSRYRLILTGTPITQGVVDLYGQMRFLSPLILGYSSFWAFARNHLEYEVKRDAYGNKRMTGRIVAAHNEAYLASKMAPYVYQVTKDECLDLPDKLHTRCYCAMNSEQRRLYEWAKEEILLQVELDEWSSIQIFRVFTALQSIVCGFWNRRDPATGKIERITVEHDRLNLLDGVVRRIEPDEKVVVWAKYRNAVREIVRNLANEHGPDAVAQFHGDLSEAERAAQVERWRREARFMVATQSSGGHGQTWTEARYAIFYADGFKYSERVQAEDRIHRIGQTRRPVYATLHCSHSIDDRIATAIERKQSVVEAFRMEIEACKAQGLKQRAIELARSL